MPTSCHQKLMKQVRLKDAPRRVPRAGVEPARVAPLVFETSASTDSAIWAEVTGVSRACFQMRCKGTHIF